MRWFVVVLLLCPIGQAAAQVHEEAVRKSRLALSAFECSVLAPNDEDVERLFQLGYESGKAFIELVEKSPANAETRREIAFLWLSVGGPTPDFILGAVYAFVADHVYDELGTEVAQRDFMKMTKYQDKNCALLGR